MSKRKFLDILAAIRQTHNVNLFNQTELRFCLDRQWKFDYYDKSLMIAIEYEGMFVRKKNGWKVQSRHLTPTGYSNDCEKYAMARILGWWLIEITPIMVRDGRAYQLIKTAIEQRRLLT